MPGRRGGYRYGFTPWGALATAGRSRLSRWKRKNRALLRRRYSKQTQDAMRTFRQSHGTRRVSFKRTAYDPYYQARLRNFQKSRSKHTVSQSAMRRFTKAGAKSIRGQRRQVLATLGGISADGFNIPSPHVQMAVDLIRDWAGDQSGVAKMASRNPGAWFERRLRRRLGIRQRRRTGRNARRRRFRPGGRSRRY